MSISPGTVKMYTGMRSNYVNGEVGLDSILELAIEELNKKNYIQGKFQAGFPGLILRMFRRGMGSKEEFCLSTVSAKRCLSVLM